MLLVLPLASLPCIQNFSRISILNQLARPEPLLPTTTITWSEHPPADVEEILPVFNRFKSAVELPFKILFLALP